MKKFIYLLLLVVPLLSHAQTKITGLVTFGNGTISGNHQALTDEQGKVSGSYSAVTGNPASEWVTTPTSFQYGGNAVQAIVQLPGNYTVSDIWIKDGNGVNRILVSISQDAVTWTDGYVFNCNTYGNQWIRHQISNKVARYVRLIKLSPGNIREVAVFGTVFAGDTQAPTVPTGLTASNITTGSFTLSWTNSTDNVAVTGYDVFKDGSQILSTTSNSLNITGLNAGQTYSFQVKAKDAAGNLSALSTGLSVTMQSNPVSPPILLYSLYLNFSDEFGTSVTHYNNLKPTFGQPLAAGTSFSSLKTFTDSTTVFGLTVTTGFTGVGGSNTSCSVTGGAYDANALCRWWSTTGTSVFKFTGLDTSKVYAIQLLSGSGTNNAITNFTVGDSTKTLNGQNNITNVVNFYNQKSNASGEISVIVARNGGYFEAGVNVGKLSVYNKKFGTGGSGGSDTQAPTIPTGLTATSVTSSSFTLNWTNSTDNVAVSGYDIFRNGILIGSTTTGTSYNLTGLNPSTTYPMQVRAKDAAGNISNLSATLSVTTSAAGAGTEMYIPIDTNQIAYRQGVSFETYKLFDEPTKYANNQNPTSQWNIEDRGGFVSAFRYTDNTGAGLVTTGAILDVDLGKEYDITKVIHSYSLSGGSGSIKIYAGSAWTSFPSTGQEAANYNSTPFYTNSSSFNGWTQTGVTTTRARFLKIVFDSKERIPTELQFIGIPVTTSYVIPTLVTTTKRYPMRRIISITDNENLGGIEGSHGVIFYGIDGGGWRAFMSRIWAVNQTTGKIMFNPAATGVQDDYDYMFLNTRKRGGYNHPAFFNAIQKESTSGDYFNENRPHVPGANPYDWTVYPDWVQNIYQIYLRYGNTSGTSANATNLDPSNATYVNLDTDVTVEDNNEEGKVWKSDNNESSTVTNPKYGHSSPRMGASRLHVVANGRKGFIGGNVGFLNIAPNAKITMSSSYRTPDMDMVRGYRMYFNTYDTLLLRKIIINTHHYSNVEYGNGLSSQGGISPERDNLNGRLKSLVLYKNTYMPFSSVWRTEGGFDVHPSSVMRAATINGKSAHVVRGEWWMRDLLICAEEGIEVSTWHMGITNNYSGQTFETSGAVGYGSPVPPANNPYYLPYIRSEVWFNTRDTKFAVNDRLWNRNPSSGNASVKIKVFRDTVTSAIETFALHCPTENDTKVLNYVLTLPAGTTNAVLIKSNNFAQENNYKPTPVPLTITNNAGVLTVTIDTVSERTSYVMVSNAAVVYPKVHTKLTLQTSWVSGSTDAYKIADEQSKVGEPHFRYFTQLPSGSNFTGGSAIINLQGQKDLVALHLISEYDGTFTVSGSNDGTNWTQLSNSTWNKGFLRGGRWTAFYFYLNTNYQYLKIDTTEQIREASVTINN